MKITELLNEGKSRSCIVVDVQPVYADGRNKNENLDMFQEMAQFLLKQKGPILMFVNAERDGLTDDTVESVKDYWNEELGIDYDETFWNRVTLVDKGYGYLRSWMDHWDVDNAAIIKTIRLMYKQKVTDSRMLFGNMDDDAKDDYESRMGRFLGDQWNDWMSDDPISVEWTSVAQLKKFSGSYIMGGGRKECLREVELLMNAFNIKYKRIEDFVYG